MLLAAANDWIHTVVPIVVVLVWIIGAIAKGLGQVQDAAPKPVPRAANAEPLRLPATEEEREKFLREFGGRSEAANPQPTRRKKERKPEPAPKPKRPLRVELESRPGGGLHSRLENSHLQGHIKQSAADIEAARPTVRLPRKPHPVLGSLGGSTIAKAYILSQVLGPPPSIGNTNANPVFGPPVGQ